MIRRLTIAGILAVVGVLTALPAYATHTGDATVNATVTPGVISVTTTGSQLAYGTRNLATIDNEPGSQDCGADTNAAFTATNNGTLDAAFTIRGANSSPGGWVLDEGGAIGADQYVHRFATDGTFCTWDTLDTSDKPLEDPVAKDDVIFVFLKMDMPDETTVTDAQTLPVTVVASGT